MVNNTQKKFIEGQLNTFGIISRNMCLKNYISRLGAIIYNLKKEGWDFSTYWDVTEHGKDFVYKVIKKPNVPVGSELEWENNLGRANIPGIEDKGEDY